MHDLGIILAMQIQSIGRNPHFFLLEKQGDGQGERSRKSVTK